jgi:hypothetical protein
MDFFNDNDSFTAPLPTAHHDVRHETFVMGSPEEQF